MASVHSAQNAIETVKADGRAEANRDNAIKMKKKGIPDDVIADITGLPIDEIQLL